MKAIIVIYTNMKLTSSKEIGAMKKYTFNTEADVKEGDMIASPNYSTTMQVVKILDKPYAYYNKVTGDLSDEYTSTNQWKIVTLVVAPKVTDAIYGIVLSQN